MCDNFVSSDDRTRQSLNTDEDVTLNHTTIKSQVCQHMNIHMNIDNSLCHKLI